MFCKCFTLKHLRKCCKTFATHFLQMFCKCFILHGVEFHSLCGSEVTWKIKQLEIEGARAPTAPQWATPMHIHCVRKKTAYSIKSINQSIKSSICKAPLKQSSQRCLLACTKSQVLRPDLNSECSRLTLLFLRWGGNMFQIWGLITRKSYDFS